MAARKRNDNRPASSAGTVFWLAAIVIVLFIFALNWGKIQETLARTNFHEIVKTNSGDKAPSAPKPSDALKPSGAAAKPQAQTPQASPDTEPRATSPRAAAKPQAAPMAAQPPTQTGTTTVAATTVAATTVAKDQGAQDAAKLPKASASATGAKSRSASLFFVRIDDDGAIVRQEVKRQVAVSDSPLLDSLAALIKGPSEDELRKKLVSLVPQGTKLLSAQVRGSTAFLNFNEAFMYNHYGIEGYAGQLKQVVYTATSFPTVQDVQILIEGEKHDYLGGEGVFIGRPLSRNSF